MFCIGDRLLVRGPLLHALFDMQDSRVSGPFELGYVMGHAKLLGAVRIRQIRVATNSCAISQLRQVHEQPHLT